MQNDIKTNISNWTVESLQHYAHGFASGDDYVNALAAAVDMAPDELDNCTPSEVRNIKIAVDEAMKDAFKNAPRTPTMAVDLDKLKFKQFRKFYSAFREGQYLMACEHLTPILPDEIEHYHNLGVMEFLAIVNVVVRTFGEGSQGK